MREPRMNAQTQGKLLHGPGFASTTTDEPKAGIGFWERRALDLRLKTMSDTSTPKWNPTVVTTAISLMSFFLMLITMIVGATWYIATQAQEIKQLKLDVQSAQAEARQAKDISLDNKNQEPPEPTPKEKRK